MLERGGNNSGRKRDIECADCEWVYERVSTHGGERSGTGAGGGDDQEFLDILGVLSIRTRKTEIMDLCEVRRRMLRNGLMLAPQAGVGYPRDPS